MYVTASTKVLPNSHSEISLSLNLLQSSGAHRRSAAAAKRCGSSSQWP